MAMTEHMGILLEVWPVAADRDGIWLLADDAWRSDRLPADTRPHGEVELLAYQHAPDLPIAVYHSTSWRFDDPGVILTYIAVANLGEHVQDWWPLARPVTLDLLATVGKPWPHRADAEPVPRYLDVLVHAIRHLRFLRDTDAETSAALGPWWARHLEVFEPALSGLYTDRISA
jgi:hypothetical protein